MRCYGCMKEKQQSPICEHCGFNENTGNQAHQLPVGTVLKEQYLVGKVLGQGGFGITYLGWDLYLDSPVAIKEFFPSGSVMRESTVSLEVKSYTGDAGNVFRSNRQRFMNEAKALARFANVPQIVQVRNFFLANETAYIIMEYVEGINLKDYIRSNGLLTMDRAMALLQPVMEALDKVHQSGIVHRDISPDNIMLLPNGGVKLLDFGAVREVRDATPDKELAQSTVAILKQGFAPIEQYQARGALGPWTDVYAMTATLLYCLTGKVPAEAPERLLDEEDLHLEQRLPMVPAAQRAAIEHGLALRADKRTASMAELLRELAQPAVEDIPMTMPLVEPAFAPMTEVGEAELPPATEISAQKADPAADAAVSAQKTKKKWRRRVVVRVLVAFAAFLLLGTFYVDPADRFLADINLDEREIVSITFLSATEDAPWNAEKVHDPSIGDVLVWKEKSGELYDLYIAAEGGIQAGPSLSGFFDDMYSLERISFNNAFDTSAVTDMSSMFRRCYDLTEVDVSGFDTSDVTDMSYMFYDCGNLTVLDVSGFDTSNVEYMHSTFDGCRSLPKLDVSGFDTSGVTDMSGMFRSCRSLAKLDVSGFDTSDVTDMSEMFYNCVSLTELDVSGFDVSGVTDMEGMFDGCDRLPQETINALGKQPQETVQTPEKQPQETVQTPEKQPRETVQTPEKQPQETVDVPENKKEPVAQQPTVRNVLMGGGAIGQLVVRSFISGYGPVTS